MILHTGSLYKTMRGRSDVNHVLPQLNTWSIQQWKKVSCNTEIDESLGELKISKKLFCFPLFLSSQQRYFDFIF